MFKYDFRERDVQNIMKELWMFKYNEIGIFKFSGKTRDIQIFFKRRGFSNMDKK